MSFTNLHLHTDFSILDGMGKISEYVERAKELGQTAIAITDHGTMGGCIEFYNTCEANGIKPIIGCEFYEAPESRTIKAPIEGESNYYHLVLLAKNEEGYKNLCRLMTTSNVEGFYHKPRIDKDLLSKYHDGIVCLSGCVAGRVQKDIVAGNLERAKEHIREYKDIFGEDFYLEVQNHGLDDELKVLKHAPALAKECNVKLVATNDCHYVYKEDREPHEWLLAMQTKKTIYDKDRLIYEGDYSLKSEAEMLEIFRGLEEAVTNTKEIADKCEIHFKKELDISDYRMPNVTIPPEYENDYFGYLKDIAYEGLERLYPEGHSLREKAREQLEYELGIIKQMNFAEYFLDTRDTIKWCLDNGILVGPGRGSGVGSVMNYCVGITFIEPLAYGLLFERFLNPERISMPDIDVDYEKCFKDIIVDYEAKKNGLDKFARIQTYGTMKAKAALRDTARVAGYGKEVQDKFAKFIDASDLKATIEGTYENNPSFREFVNSSREYQKIYNIAVRLEKTKKSESTHACGVIPTPVPCADLFPSRVDAKTGYLVCQYNMTEAEHLGNLKKDLLLLNNLSIIGIAKRLVKERHGIDIDLWKNEIHDDKRALKLIAEGRTQGVFQLESAGMVDFMKKLKPDCFEDVIAGVALYRPGPMDNIPEYIARKKDASKIVYPVPELEPILKNTYGIITYQEQVMQIVQKLAGFSKGEADVVRKAMGKKKQDLIEKEGQIFLYGNEKFAGAIKNGVPEDVALELWEQMAKFGAYAFNKSHATAYASIAVYTAYFKEHFPLEMYTGLLTSSMEKITDVAKYVQDAKAEGIEVLPPDVNMSHKEFSISSDEKIVHGLNSIKGLGGKVCELIVEEREKNGEYASLYNFIERNPSVSAGVIKSLINAGAFDFTNENRPTLHASLGAFKDFYKKDRDRNESNQLTLADFIEELSVSKEPEYVKMEDWDIVTKGLAEREATGLFVKTNPIPSIDGVSYVPIKAIKDLWKTKDEAETDDFDMGEGGFAGSGTSLSEEEIKHLTYDNICIHGIISEIDEKITKKGYKYLSVTIVDELESLRVNIWSNVYQDMLKNGASFGINDIVTVTGKTNFDKVLDGGVDFGASIAVSEMLHDSEVRKKLQKKAEQEKRDEKLCEEYLGENKKPRRRINIFFNQKEND